MRLNVKASLQYAAAFLGHVARRFWDDRCLMVASELAYTTLLTLVPLMAVVFSVLAAFPVFQKLIVDIQEFIFRNFVPAVGEVVERYLLEFVHQASGMTAIGVLFLVLTALMMMGTIDRALNDIWRARSRHRLLPSFLVYWAVLTLGPMLIGTSLAVTSYLVSLPLFADTGSAGLKAGLLRLMPFLATTLAFWLLYVAVPNRIISWRHALVGALVAAILFTLANRGFAIYVTQYATYEKVYGALAAIPVFLVWIYVSWLVILLGAEITHSLTTFRTSLGDSVTSPKGMDLVYAYRIVGHLWTAQAEGRGLSTQQLLRLEPMLTEAKLEELLRRLAAARLVQRTVEGRWIFSRDMSEMTLLELYRSAPYVLPDVKGTWGAQHPWNGALQGVLLQANACVEQSMQVPLKSLYLKAANESATPAVPDTL
jgi:membrane protein